MSIRWFEVLIANETVNGSAPKNKDALLGRNRGPGEEEAGGRS